MGELGILLSRFNDLYPDPSKILIVLVIVSAQMSGKHQFKLFLGQLQKMGERVKSSIYRMVGIYFEENVRSKNKLVT